MVGNLVVENTKRGNLTSTDFQPLHMKETPYEGGTHAHPPTEGLHAAAAQQPFPGDVRR